MSLLWIILHRRSVLALLGSLDAATSKSTTDENEFDRAGLEPASSSQVTRPRPPRARPPARAGRASAGTRRAGPRTRMSAACSERVELACRSTIARTRSHSGTLSGRTCDGRTHAAFEESDLVEYVELAAAHARGRVPPDLAEHDDGAARHVFARVVACPSTTATAPELRTASRSPARPAQNSSPPVAPYSAVLPISTGSPASPAGGR